MPGETRRDTSVALGDNSLDNTSYFCILHSEDVQDGWSCVSISCIYDILLHLVGILYHVRMILP
jgi:hypothetical protein